MSVKRVILNEKSATKAARSDETMSRAKYLATKAYVELWPELQLMVYPSNTVLRCLQLATGYYHGESEEERLRALTEFFYNLLDKASTFISLHAIVSKKSSDEDYIKIAKNYFKAMFGVARIIDKLSKPADDRDWLLVDADGGSLAGHFLGVKFDSLSLVSKHSGDEESIVFELSVYCGNLSDDWMQHRIGITSRHVPTTTGALIDLKKYLEQLWEYRD